MIVWKKNVLEELKKKGYTTYSLQKDKVIASQTLNDITNGKMVGIKAIDRICGLLKCQPSALIEWQPDETE